ncbi:MAG: ribose-phosphate diphosphokinase [Gammaproteobacteria bacterium]|nr:ribose-phosphate diphosphokinase [Gammaproteobacteria bacterium]
MLLGFPESISQAQALAEELQLPCAEVQLHTFPDGESLIQLPPELPDTVIIYRSLNAPNSKLVELYLVSEHLREQGVKQQILVAPYLCYMRQDKSFAPGQIISQRHIGHWLANLFDALITVDPHLHRVTSLEQAIPVKHASTLHATQAISDFIQSHYPQDIILLGPDSESEQWVASLASPMGLQYAVASKTRRGDRKVEIQLPAINFKQRHVVMVDDIISSGHTMMVACGQLKLSGASQVDCIITHALFTEETIKQLNAAGITQIISSDTVVHSSNKISLLQTLSAELGRLLNHE